MKNLASEFEAALSRLIKNDCLESWAWAWARLDEGGAVTYPHQTRPLDAEMWEKVVIGIESIGIFLANPKTLLTKVGVIDIDTPRDAATLEDGLALAQKIAQRALEAGLKAYIEFSGRRGYHIWIFASEPLLAGTMNQALKALALKAGFEAKETFPHVVGGKETKVIKLPWGVHLGTGRRSGFLDPEGNCQDSVQAQLELLSSFEPSPRAKLIELTQSLDESKPAARVERGLISLGGSEPACIAHLVNNGAVLDLDYHLSNTLLARYAVTKGLGDDEARALAESMAKASEKHSTSKKTVTAKVKHFESCLKAAKARPHSYEFDCGYALDGLGGQPASTRGCVGSKCPVHKEHPTNRASVAIRRPLTKLIFQSLINLSSQGVKPSQGLILEGVENLITSENDEGDPDPAPQAEILESIELQEKEALSHLISNPPAIAFCSDLPPQGFVSKSSATIGEYLDDLLNCDSINFEVFNIYLGKIRDRGVKCLAIKATSKLQEKFESDTPIVESLDIGSEVIRGLINQSIGNSELATMSSHVDNLWLALFAETKQIITTCNSHLDYLLSGGFKGGYLYVLAAPPASGKTTLAAQFGDAASALGYTVVFASFEMGRMQLWVSSLSRISQIDSTEIENLSPKSASEKMLLSLGVAKVYFDEKIAANQIILEADGTYTPARLKAVCMKLGADMLVVDYLQLLSSGDDKLDSSHQETLRVSKIASDLKRVARSLDIPILAISDINKNAYLKAVAGGDLDMGALRDSFKIAHAADTIMLLQSGDVTLKEGRVDQLDLIARRTADPLIAEQIGKLKAQYPLDPKLSETYSRLTLVKNRRGRLGEPIFKFIKATQSFQELRDLDFETATGLGGVDYDF